MTFDNQFYETDTGTGKPEQFTKSDKQNLTWQQQVEYRKVREWGRDQNLNNRIRLELGERSRVSVRFEPTAEEVVEDAGRE